MLPSKCDYLRTLCPHFVLLNSNDSIGKGQPLGGSMDIQEFKTTVKNRRIALIPKPKQLVYEAISESAYSLWDADQVRRYASSFMVDIRELVWQKYLEYEREFNVDIADVLTDSMEEIPLNSTPKEIIASFLYNNADHLFELAKSSSNSRRTRAGKVFEVIFEEMLSKAEIPFDSQGKIGSSIFDDASLGKLVDCVIPSVEQYRINKRDCILVSMKTSLRERWQEVVEEMRRTGVAEMMLATVDEGVSSDTLDKLASHNITLIVPRVTKQAHYQNDPRVYDFEWLLAECSKRALS